MHCSSIWSLTHSSVIRKHSAISASLAFNVFSFITCSVVFPYCSILPFLLNKFLLSDIHCQVIHIEHPFKISVWISCVNDEGSSLFVFYATRGQYETILGLCMNFFFCYVWIWSFEFYFCSWFFACTALFCFLQGATDSRHSNASVTTPILHRKNSKFLKSSFKTVSVGTIILAAES